MGNAQGSYYFLSLNSSKLIARNNWTTLPMPVEVIAKVHQLAKACKKYYGIICTDKDGNITNDDNNPEQENLDITGGDDDKNEKVEDITGVQDKSEEVTGEQQNNKDITGVQQKNEDAIEVHNNTETDNHEPENYEQMEHDDLKDKKVSIENESHDNTYISMT